jgi:hypothetical protein
MQQEQVIFQKIEHVESGEELDLSWLKSANFVETLDLSGPRLMLEFDDKYRLIRDRLGMVERDRLRLTLSDVYARDGMDEVLEFTVLTMPVSGDYLKINAILKIVFDLKTPAVTSTAFVKKQCPAILSRLMPGFTLDTGRFPATEDYHLLAGERPSFMLRQMAREQGAHIYARRTYACMHRLSDLLQAESAFTYHHDDARQENQIVQYQFPSAQHVLEDRILRDHQGWNITDGWIQAGENGVPPEIYSSQNRSTLRNLNAAPMPVLDFTCYGNGFLMPGMALDFVWNVQDLEKPLDEGMPEKAVIGTVAHWYKANRYLCRVKCVLPLERSSNG